jgi:hypothetical protein
VTKKTKTRAVRAKKSPPAAGVARAKQAACTATHQGWRWVIDNRMRDYGECDFQNRIIRINMRLHFMHLEAPIDTLLHEDLHRLYPDKSEREILKLTEYRLKRLTKKQKARYYAILGRAHEQHMREQFGGRARR